MEDRHGMLLARGLAVIEDDVDTDGSPRHQREAWTKIKQSSSEIAEDDRAWVVNFLSPWCVSAYFSRGERFLMNFANCERRSVSAVL